MRNPPPFRSHTPWTSRFWAIMRALLLTVMLVVLSVGFVRMLWEGVLEVPLRHSHLIVTTAQPFWFGVVALIWVVMLAVLAVVAWMFVCLALQPRYPS